MNPSLSHYLWEGRGGLVVRSRFWGRRVPGSKPDSTEDPACKGACCTPNVLPLVGRLERECQLMCRHLTVVQICEVRPKIALVLLQNGTLILLKLN
ncbi:hypothetical protein AVEN_14493-1 [Araneus ventricosus]|uniref:Uncharacterized protein n=1 Tax=Araneus ventricosus TaxID=182803 RepID=A0A4Y2VXR6_ARAVE|nr:hypothetical protein AVEN_103817-1 [Araneus ventricosus]GBO29498.1 hypothetical protein AVEN_135885-1 [Araneus ventricosus]GBO29501.1 hypothetical protein AVEN_189563-1 [Araneus ventricosus]GBO29502.1 hypothetical protein AVEN_14493-1 [Araneus ventricosus]